MKNDFPDESRFCTAKVRVRLCTVIKSSTESTWVSNHSKIVLIRIVVHYECIISHVTCHTLDCNWKICTRELNGHYVTTGSSMIKHYCSWVFEPLFFIHVIHSRRICPLMLGISHRSWWWRDTILIIYLVLYLRLYEIKRHRTVCTLDYKLQIQLQCSTAVESSTFDCTHPSRKQRCSCHKQLSLWLHHTT